MAEPAIRTERSGGRPRDPALDLGLREAALDLLAERGYDHLTIDAVAARVGSGRTSVYRRWSSKAELVIDALDSLKPKEPVPDTGSLRGDLEGLCRQITAEPDGRSLAVMRGLASALPHDHELMAAFDQRFVGPRRAAMRLLFERAVERGEMAPGRDLDLLTSVVPALMLHRILTTGTPPDPAFGAGVIEEVLLPAAVAREAPSAEPTTKTTSRRRSRHVD